MIIGFLTAGATTPRGFTMNFVSLGIVSDSHNNDYAIQAALNVFKRHGVDQVVHCGDVVSPEHVKYFSDFKTTFVVGNNDDEAELAVEAAKIGAVVLPQPVCLDWHGKKLFLVHGHDGGKDAAETAFRSGDWDLVCYGHTHIADLREIPGTIILNPGALRNGDFCIFTGAGVLHRMNIEDFE